MARAGERPFEPPRVLFIAETDVVPESELVARIRAAANLPSMHRARLGVQLRSKSLSGRARFELGQRLAREVRAIGGSFFVNDRVDIANALDADGVHLGGRSMSVRDARSLVGPRFVTVACHSIEDVLEAADAGADGALLAPIFETPGKGSALGVEAIERSARALESTGHPRFFVVALGGIDANRVRPCFEAGAGGVAVIRADLGAALANSLAKPSDFPKGQLP